MQRVLPLMRIRAFEARAFDRISLHNHSSFIHSHISYSSVSWGIAYCTHLTSIQIIQNQAIKIATSSPFRSNAKSLLRANNTLTVQELIEHNLGTDMYKTINNQHPHLSASISMFTNTNVTRFVLNNNFILRKARTAGRPFISLGLHFGIPYPCILKRVRFMKWKKKCLRASRFSYFQLFLCVALMQLLFYLFLERITETVNSPVICHTFIRILFASNHYYWCSFFFLCLSAARIKLFSLLHCTGGPLTVMDYGTSFCISLHMLCIFCINNRFWSWYFPMEFARCQGWTFRIALQFQF